MQRTTLPYFLRADLKVGPYVDHENAKRPLGFLGAALY